jgi:hypothetical protein
MTAVHVYQSLFAASIATNVFVGFACIFAPIFAAKIMGMPLPPSPSAMLWMRGWGGTLVALHVFFAAGLLGFFAPAGTAFVNLASIGIKIWMGTIWLSCGKEFRWFAKWDLAWSAALLVAYSVAIYS